tara:strand:- start:533 stop:664 length:132 start_codon:yes stop_codon:yes gene_type:complete
MKPGTSPTAQTRRDQRAKMALIYFRPRMALDVSLDSSEIVFSE